MITITFSFDITDTFTLRDLKEYVRLLESNGCAESHQIRPTVDNADELRGFEAYL